MIRSYNITLDFENQKLKQTFQSNRYPKDLVNRCIKMYLVKCLLNTWICIAPKKDFVCVFAFLGKLSLEIKKQLQNAIERTLPYLHLKLSAIFISKICLLKNSHLASFSFKCNSCNAIYYRKTKRYFYVRAAEHKDI